MVVVNYQKKNFRTKKTYKIILVVVLDIQNKNIKKFVYCCFVINTKYFNIKIC